MNARELAARYGYAVGCGAAACAFGPQRGKVQPGKCVCFPANLNVYCLTSDEYDAMRKMFQILVDVLKSMADDLTW